MSQLKVDTITDEAGTGAPNFANGLTGNGSGLTNLSAANLTGALPAISGAALTNLPAPTSAQVGAATAGLAADAVGTYSLLCRSTGTSNIIKGTTYAGSSLVGFVMQERIDTDTVTAVQHTARDLTARAGTWLAMSTSNTSLNAAWSPAALFLRIS
jgi:hypothetical protein